jgi:2-dehydropantoate 2-reductase
MSDAKFAVYGAGGLGGYFAAVLARAGYWVGLIARGGQLEAIRANGLHVESPKGSFEARPARVAARPEEIGPVDAVILAVKAWQVSEAAEAMRPLLSAGTKVLPLQNGVDASEQIEKVLGRDHTLIGLCKVLSAVTAPGHIRYVGMEATVSLGESNGGELSANAKLLAGALRKAGVAVDTPSDMRAALWGKLLFIAAMSGVGAVSRSTVGEIRQSPQTRGLLQQVMEEVRAVAVGRGVRLADDVVTKTLEFVETLPSNGTASMQRDIADGKPSELEAIIGAVARYGDQAGIATPATDLIYASLLPQEQRARGK